MEREARARPPPKASQATEEVWKYGCLSYLVSPNDVFLQKHTEIEIVDGYKNVQIMNNMLHFLEKSFLKMCYYIYFPECIVVIF